VAGSKSLCLLHIAVMSNFPIKLSCDFSISNRVQVTADLTIPHDTPWLNTGTSIKNIMTTHFPGLIQALL
jgi:hypothetical protein